MATARLINLEKSFSKNPQLDGVLQVPERIRGNGTHDQGASFCRPGKRCVLSAAPRSDKGVKHNDQSPRGVQRVREKPTLDSA